jgi:hypothetical protein
MRVVRRDRVLVWGVSNRNRYESWIGIVIMLEYEVGRRRMVWKKVSLGISTGRGDDDAIGDRLGDDK